MIIVLKPSATEEQITNFTNMLKESYDVKVNKWDGVHSIIIALISFQFTFDETNRSSSHFFSHFSTLKRDSQ